MKNVDFLKWKNSLLFFMLLMIYVTQIQCDLPIQCVKHQIVGQWTIQTSKVHSKYNQFLTCGHSIPDSPDQSIQSDQNNFKHTKEYLVDLHENGEAFLLKNSSQIKGQWTMMYDEGFQIDVDEMSFFTFFKYYPIKEEQISERVLVEDITVVSHSKVTTYEFDCTETIVGWFNVPTKNKKGCMKAYKVNPREEDRHLRSQQKGSVVQPLDFDINNFTIQDDIDQINSSQQDGLLYDQQSSSSIKKRKFNLQGTLNSIIENIGPEDSSPQSEQLELDQKQSTQKSNNINQKQNAELNQNVHKNRIDQLNSLNKNWQAGISSSFQDLTLDEVNKKAGRNKRKQQKKNSKKKVINESEMSKLNEEQSLYMHFSIQDVSDLPKNFSWEEYIDNPIEQNDCGSCYIISTVQMLNARLKIKYGKDFTKKISMQHLLDCSFYSQGCDGGYPFELGRFGKDYFMLPDNNTKFQNEVKECQIKNLEKLDEYFKVTDYGFVGQQYGKGNEREMMLEIMKNGPIVANFKTSADFVYYKSGVYHSVEAADWILKCEVEPEWRPVEHAVMCYGWGESEEDGKFWLMQNSWGDDWGEKGRFKIRRGTDESFVESSAEYAQVEYINNKQ
ncbi:papain family cysteine protease (macronuclear) [Tetrahymena thermophila SB210]|uniref:Dipeptidyl peptidase 1 n=1 Tax=Tetrahymena thermophila (strain SB210) TaxID=312017 RepID=I7MLG9_TETTS|nr:papain family cysteine protease [Tetrahymena thermophila SB210]EAS02078.2 papain family cysteine protease [Tetrahymena thermophila SB210]|eukprot:XP_001022323.2 papain family cysteine protease [Tetrahymena thermophila SB210]